VTVSTTTNKVSYSGTGSQTVFAYTFKIFADGDLDVYIRDTNGTETLQTITTNYTVSGAGTDSGGNVTFVTAPGSTDTVVIQRKLDLTQGTDYVANDPFPAESHEDALDRLTFITQQIQEEVDRSIKASVTNTISTTEFAVSATDRANKFFAFDSAGDLVVSQEIGTFRGNWAGSTSYAQRDIVKDTSTNNIFIVNTAHTSSGAQPLTSNANSAKYDLLVDAATATTSATTATTQATAASTSATAAATSATAAANSATAAATSETNASTSETNASTSESNAATSESNASTSATSASTSATTATTKASEASTSATNAATSETNASTSETNAATSATTATTKASEAATSATNASTSETNAATSATTATTKASEASTSATNAAASETAAGASQTAAANSAAALAAALDTFDDKYLGTMGDSDTASSATTTGTWVLGGSTITVASATGIEVGQNVSATGIPNQANVLAIDGTSISISHVATAAGSGAAVTFQGYGVYGAFSSGIDGPSTDNDNGALAEGMLYFNTTDNEMRVYDGANWIAASAATQASMNIFEYTATASQTTFSGSDDNSATLSYTADNLIVMMNGAVLDPDEFTATNGTSVVLDSGAALNDELVIFAFKSFQVADTVSKASGGTFNSSVTVTGTLNATTDVQVNGASVATMGKSIAMAIVFGG